MHIQWFPGHMTKALREIENNLKKIDVVIYMLDARAIQSSFNKKFDDLIQNKKVLYVINKCDLVKSSDLIPWKKKFAERNKESIFVSSVSSNDKKIILNKINIVSKEIVERYKSKGVNKTIRAMVLGMPNTGKSTLINLLAPFKKAVTGNKAGVTRGLQFVKIGEFIELYDTPGTLVPAFENQEIAIKLALIGSINDEILDMNELAVELIKILKKQNNLEFLERYKQEKYLEDTFEQIEEIAKARGYVLSQGKLDSDRCAKALILELRAGKIGKIMFDFV